MSAAFFQGMSPWRLISLAFQSRCVAAVTEQYFKRDTLWQVGSVLAMIGTGDRNPPSQLTFCHISHYSQPHADGRNAPLGVLLRHLRDLTAGPHAGPTLRLGGNSADDSAYLNRSEVLPPGIDYAIGEKDLDAYVTFGSETAREANVTFIIDTNFGTSPDPRKYALPHVQAVVQHPGLLSSYWALENNAL